MTWGACGRSMFPRRRTTKDSRQSSPKKRTKPAHTHKRTGRSAHNWRSWRFPAPAARCAFIQKPSSGSSALKGQRFLRPTPLVLYYFCFSRRRCPSTSFSRRSYCSFSLPICYRPCRFAIFSSNLVMGNSHKHSGFFLFFLSLYLSYFIADGMLSLVGVSYQEARPLTRSIYRRNPAK